MKVSGLIHAPAAFIPGKELRCPLNRTMGGWQGRAVCFGEAKNLLLLFGFELWTVQPARSVPAIPIN
jgi:hypothetical protein